MRFNAVDLPARLSPIRPIVSSLLTLKPELETDYKLSKYSLRFAIVVNQKLGYSKYHICANKNPFFAFMIATRIDMILEEFVNVLTTPNTEAGSSDSGFSYTVEMLDLGAFLRIHVSYKPRIPLGIKIRMSIMTTAVIIDSYSLANLKYSGVKVITKAPIIGPTRL